MIIIKVKRLDERAIIPTKNTEEDSGYDLYAIEDVTIGPGETVLIRTGLALGIPKGFEIQIRPRSGMSLKTPFRVANSPGTVDMGFTGEIKVIGNCMSVSKTVEIKAGDRIAQAVLQAIPESKMIEVEELEDTIRGSGGFGSSGV